MTYIQLNEIDAPLIDLTYGGGLGLIIQVSSGVHYTNQTGGYSCLHPNAEGVYLPLIEEVVDQEKLLLNYFDGEKHKGCCDNGIDSEDADYIDKILADSFHTKFLSVDRTRLNESHEAWVFVTIQEHPDKHPKLPAQWSEEVASLLFGFSGKKGIITWCNSD